MLTNELMEQGYAVRVFDRLYYGDAGLRDCGDRVELIPGDMRSVDASVLENVLAVANVGGPSNDPTTQYNPKANHEMTGLTGAAVLGFTALT